MWLSFLHVYLKSMHRTTNESYKLNYFFSINQRDSGFLVYKAKKKTKANKYIENGTHHEKFLWYILKEVLQTECQMEMKGIADFELILILLLSCCQRQTLINIAVIYIKYYLILVVQTQTSLPEL